MSGASSTSTGSEAGGRKESKKRDVGTAGKPAHILHPIVPAQVQFKSDAS